MSETYETICEECGANDWAVWYAGRGLHDEVMYCTECCAIRGEAE